MVDDQYGAADKLVHANGCIKEKKGKKGSEILAKGSQEL